MNVLVASAEPDWETWIATVLVPVAEAFGFRVIRLNGPGDTAAFSAQLSRKLEECDAAISVHPEAPQPPGDWPLKALAAVEARPSGRALLLRRPAQQRQYPAQRDIECDAADPLTALIKTAAVLGDWYQSPHGRFQLGPAVRISGLLQQFGADRISAEYRVRTHIGDLTDWRRATFIREGDRAEVLTRKPAGGGAVQVRILVNREVFGETEFTTLDRRVLELSQPPQELAGPIDPRQ